MYIENIKKLNYPQPYKAEKQTSYIKRILLKGYSIDTRICRYIGIGNLHSIVSHFKKSQFLHTLEHKRVVDPATGTTPPYPVDVVYMTDKQIQVYKRKNAQHK